MTRSNSHLPGINGRPNDDVEELNLEAGSDSGEPASLSKDLIFELLKNARRRRVLRYLESHERTELSTLAEHIAAKENDVDKGMLTSTQRKRVYIALYQCHLPKLDDTGVIEYEQARGTVSITPTAGQLFPYLKLGQTPENASDTGFSEIVANTVDRIRSSSN